MATADQLDRRPAAHNRLVSADGVALTRTSWLGPSLWLFAATALGNVCNFLYHLYMVRHLAPAHYAMLTALIASMTILAVPAMTVQTTTSHRAAQLGAQGAWDQLRADLRRRFAVGGLVAVGAWVSIILCRHALTEFLQFPEAPAVIIAWGAAVALGFLIPIALGALQGLQVFTGFGVNLMLHGVLKLLLGALGVAMGWAVFGAVQGIVVATAIVLVMAVFQVRVALRQRHPKSSSGLSWWRQASVWAVDGITECWLVLRNPWGISRYTAVVALSVMAYTSLTNVDMVMAKHYLEPAEAGHYAIGAMVSRAVLFIPMALSMVLFPKVAEATALGRNARPLLHRAMLATALLSGVACLICLQAPNAIIRLMAGTVYPETLPIVRILAVAMACLAVSNLVLVYLLAAQRTALVLPFLAIAMGHIVAITAWHTVGLQIAWVTFGCAVILVTYSVSIAWK